MLPSLGLMADGKVVNGQHLWYFNSYGKKCTFLCSTLLKFSGM